MKLDFQTINHAAVHALLVAVAVGPFRFPTASAVVANMWRAIQHAMIAGLALSAST